MVALADKTAVYLLQFADQPDLQRRIDRIEKRTKCTAAEGVTEPLCLLSTELDAFFRGDLKKFQTPIHLFGSEFQRKAWEALLQIPYGETRSYRDQAVIVGNPLACRAVALANSANPLPILVPCHRIIQSDGACGGYGGGVWRKRWLLEQEEKHR